MRPHSFAALALYTALEAGHIGYRQGMEVTVYVHKTTGPGSGTEIRRETEYVITIQSYQSDSNPVLSIQMGKGWNCYLKIQRQGVNDLAISHEHAGKTTYCREQVVVNTSGLGVRYVITTPDHPVYQNERLDTEQYWDTSDKYRHIFWCIKDGSGYFSPSKIIE